MVTQPKSTQRILFTNQYPHIITTQEEAVYLIFDRLFSLGSHFTDLTITERSCHNMKHALGLIPIIDTLVRSIEERIFNLFNHLSNDPIFRLNIRVDFSPQNCQTLELFELVAKRTTGLKLERPNFLPIESPEGIQFSRTIISNFEPGPQVHAFFIPFMHRPPK